MAEEAEEQARSDAARQLGRSRSERKAAASRANGFKPGKTYERTPEIIAKQREAAKRGWEKRKASAEKEASNGTD